MSWGIVLEDPTSLHDADDDSYAVWYGIPYGIIAGAPPHAKVLRCAGDVGKGAGVEKRHECGCWSHGRSHSDNSLLLWKAA